MYLEIDEGLYAMDDINYIDYVKSDNCLIVVFKIDPKNPTTAMLQGSEADKIWRYRMTVVSQKKDFVFVEKNCLICKI